VQQALLDFAGIYADTGDSQADRKVVSVNKNCENECGDELASSNQEIELWMVESEFLSLTKPDCIGRAGTSNNADHESPQTAPKLNEHRKSPSGWVSRLELKILQLQQENHELEAKIELFEENKELTRQVNERKISELSAEINRLSLRNSSLNYNIRQAQETLAEERRKGDSAKSSRDAQITSLHINKKDLQRKIGELQIELYQASKRDLESRLCTERAWLQRRTNG
jgi:chromosome segregation ATPase